VWGTDTQPIVSGLRPKGSASAPQPTLTPAVVAFRAAHGAIAAAFLLAIAYVWWCAVTGRPGPWLRVAVVALTTEGTLVVANGGDCPLGALQGRMGDPVPLFELVLSQRAAHRAVPVLGGVAALGIALVVARDRPGAAEFSRVSTDRRPSRRA
jgi:hypothetical protein